MLTLRERAVWALVGASILLGLPSAVLLHMQPSLRYQLDDPAYRWIGQKVLDPHTRIDVAYVGTSKMWNAVDTGALNARFPATKSYNLSSNWAGRHVRYAIVRDMLRTRAVRDVVLEVGAFERRRAHPYSGFFAEFGDLPSLSSDWSGLVRRRWDDKAKAAVSNAAFYSSALFVKGYYLGAKRLFGADLRSERFAGKDRTFGYYRVQFDPRRHPDRVAKLKSEPINVRVLDETHRPPPDLVYLDRFAELCKEHGAQLWFLFVPYRNEPLIGPRYRAELEKRGRLIEFGVEVLFDYELWRDYGHLNTRGAALFTDWLASSSLYATSTGADEPSP